MDDIPHPDGYPARSRHSIDRYLPASDQDSSITPKQIDFATVRGFFWRQRYLLIGTVSLAVLLGFVVTLLMTPIFQAKTSVRVDPEQQEEIFESGTLTSQISLLALDSYLGTLVAVVKSRAMAERVVDALKLDRSDDFLGLTADTPPQGTSNAQWAKDRRKMAVALVAGGVDAKVPLGQRIIDITFTSADPVMAARIANSYADSFLTDDLRRSVQKNAYAQKYLRSQIAMLQDDLANSQRKALAFARSNRIVGQSMMNGSDESGGASSSGGTPSTITAATLESLNGSLAETRAKRIAAEQRWRTIGAGINNSTEYQTNPTVQRLSAERATIATRLAEQRVRYGANHPVIRELEAQLVTLDRQLGQTSAQLRASLRKEYEIAQREENALTAELASVAGQTLDEQDRRVTLDQLNNDSRALQTQLATLLDRYNQISASANVRPSTMTLLDSASVPAIPISPNLPKNMLVALVLGLGIALGLAVLRETLDDRLRSSLDVEEKLGLPLLGLTPLLEDKAEVSESGALAEAHSSIRAAVDFSLPRRSHNVVALTSSQSGEGKTTTAVALAQEYARLNQRVLLVDSDLRRPNISRRFGLKRPKIGYAEVLAGTATLQEALLPNTIPNLDVLPVGAIPPNPVEIVSSPRAEEFFVEQRERYDMIIVDCPPVMGIADAPLIAHHADGVVFVVESNRAHFGAAKTALRRLRDGDATTLGVVLTKFRALDAGQSYDYQYSYYSYGTKKNS